MLVLDNIARELRRNATPAQLEGLVNAIRVATDVGVRVEDRQARRTASERIN
jgi:hypothetical protein